MTTNLIASIHKWNKTSLGGNYFCSFEYKEKYEQNLRQVWLFTPYEAEKVKKESLRNNCMQLQSDCQQFFFYNRRSGISIFR